MSPGAWRYARSHAPEGPRDAVRLQLLDEGPRARLRGEAHQGGVPGPIRRNHPRLAGDARAHARRRVELALATSGKARGRVEEGAADDRLRDGHRAHRPLAPRRAGDAGLACDTRRRRARADPRSRARLAAERTLSTLVLLAAHPRTHAAAAQRRCSLADADAAIAGEHRLPRLRRPP